MANTKKSIGEQNYEQFAQRYADYVLTKPHNAYYDRPAVLSMLPDVAGKRVLDAGCGPGLYTQALLERGAEVVAFDVTPAFVRITQERVGKRARVLRADINQPLTFADDASFDLVIAPLVFDYVPDLAPVYAEIARVLNPGGYLVYSVSEPHSLWEYLKRRVIPESDRDARAWSYFKREQFTTTWRGFGKPEPEITSYHRPLADFLNPMIQNGLHLDELLEPQPTPEFADHDPERYERMMRNPLFMVIRAQKPIV
jgi:SAM-dependent methyltransferase